MSAGVALLHAGIAVVGPAAYIYFGAGNFAPVAARGSPIPAILTVMLALVFATWAWYAFAGAGVVRRRPPLLIPGIWAIGVIYTARGVLIVTELISLSSAHPAPPRFIAFSLVSLVAGVAYLIGATRMRRR
jgi:hypothetical protein